MKTYVVQTQQIYHTLLRKEENEDIHRRIEIPVTKLLPHVHKISKCARTNEEAKAYCSKLNASLEEQATKTNSANVQRKLCVHLFMDTSKPAKCSLKIHGQFLQDLFYHCEALPKLKLVGEYGIGTVHLSTTDMSICIPGDTSTSEESEGCSNNDPFCEDQNVTITSTCEGYFRTSSDYLYFSLIVNETHYDSVPDKMSTLKKILTESVQTDFTLVTTEGTNLPCNKVFLAAHSTVLAAMLKVDMDGPKTNKMEVKMTEESVKALLSYLYLWEIKIPCRKPNIALDLLQAGHKYEIQPLKDSMRNILLTYPKTAVEANDAMRMFLFARNLEEFGDLKMKAVQILKLNSKELLQGEDYKNLLKDNPTVAAEAAMELVTIVLSQCDCDITELRDPTRGNDSTDATKKTPAVANQLPPA